MTSIHTNSGAISALHTLRGITSSLNETQVQISSGMRVNNASDNAAYWSIATTMRSETKALSAVEDSIGLARAIVDVTYSGLDNVRESLVRIRNLVITARTLPAATANNFENLSPNPVNSDSKFAQTQLAKVDSEINQLLASMYSTIKSSSFGGVNLLWNKENGRGIDDFTHDFVVDYNSGRVETLKIDQYALTLFNEDYQNHQSGPTFLETGILDSSDVVYLEGTSASHGLNLFNAAYGIGIVYFQEQHPLTSPAQPNILLQLEKSIVRHGAEREATYANFLDVFEEKINKIQDGLAYLGSTQSSLTRYAELVTSRGETYEKGVGRLVDADMDASSTRLKALQAQQQLASQSLQIANNNASTILQLFR
ncbi:flagellin [Ensifer sp. M14]|uniref:flagellin N-terminal helical domain-containing protein n=1 Tax=Ensifer sp. M14 TaxID=2203782 RepID=UPI000E1E27B3|nr:flagellin [Ensifer sp. M14]